MLYTENIVYLNSPKQMREELSTKCRSALMHNDSTKPSWNSVGIVHSNKRCNKAPLLIKLTSHNILSQCSLLS